jgi:prophage DNA circulation protein
MTQDTAISATQTSFGNATFYVESYEFDTGRRVARLEFPNRDLPYTEDLGKKTHEFSLHGFVIGDDCRAKRDAVLFECERKGPLKLIDPYLGTQLVHCISCRVSESTSELRSAHFSLIFLKAAESPAIQIRENPKESYILQTKKLSVSAMNRLSQQFSVLGESQAVINSAIKQIDSISRNISESFFPLILDDPDSLINQLNSLNNSAKNLVRKPEDLGRSIINILSKLGISKDFDSELIFHKHVTLVESYGERVTVKTPIEVSPESANSKALNLFMATVTFTSTATLALLIDFESIDQALGIRNILLERADQLLNLTPDDESYDDILKFKAQLIKTIPSQSQHLKKLNGVTLSKDYSSLVLAYELY